jgi:hypothetical protein
MPELKLPKYQQGFLHIAFQHPRYPKFCSDLANLNRNILVTRADAEIAWKHLMTALHGEWYSGPFSIEKREQILQRALLLVNISNHPFKYAQLLTCHQIRAPEADEWWSTRAYRLGNPSINDTVCTFPL